MSFLSSKLQCVWHYGAAASVKRLSEISLDRDFHYVDDDFVANFSAAFLAANDLHRQPTKPRQAFSSVSTRRMHNSSVFFSFLINNNSEISTRIRRLQSIRSRNRFHWWGLVELSKCIGKSRTQSVVTLSRALTWNSQERCYKKLRFNFQMTGWRAFGNYILVMRRYCWRATDGKGQSKASLLMFSMLFETRRCGIMNSAEKSPGEMFTKFNRRRLSIQRSSNCAYSWDSKDENRKNSAHDGASHVQMRLSFQTPRSVYWCHTYPITLETSP